MALATEWMAEIGHDETGFLMEQVNSEADSLIANNKANQQGHCQSLWVVIWSH